jgi:3-hydroxyisobutyrate dehydrogenase-like beta-hydroxyacid dehydrogenase
MRLNVEACQKRRRPFSSSQAGLFRPIESKEMNMQVGFIGLGRMGSGMAGNLIRAGHQVSLFNRTAGKAEALEALGGKVAQDIADVCQGEAVFTMLANDEAVENVVYGGILESLPRGAIHISSSTISVALSDRLAAAHAERGQRFVAAPVFGRPEAAGAAKLFVAAAGAEDAVRDVMPLLEAIGQQVTVLSDTPSTANLVKLSGNFLTASVIESLGEALAIVSKAGIDRGQYLDFLTSTMFNAPVYRTYGAMIAQDEPSPVGFAAPLGLKDIRLLLAAGDTLGVPLPLASLLRDRFLTLVARYGEALDWSAIGKLPRRDAGVMAA